MPIDLVIDERDSSKPLPDLTGSTNGNDGTRSNADSTSHDGASTPDVVSTKTNLPLPKVINFHPWAAKTGLFF